MSELIGRKLGKYTLEAQLGEGGMAAVYRSQHPQFHRPVAIKILPPTIGQDQSFRTRFEREGQMIASLNHPSIIRVYDIDEADGLFYMVMDLLPGGTLEARLREGGLDRRWSVDVIVQMAEALDYAHANGVIHRDIKPSNILLDAESRPVLADFGIARMAQPESDPNLTAAGTVMGTPAYMAPEQLTGGQPDARSDIYALGVVLYQLLAGRAPFTGDTMAVVTAHLTKQPQALRELVSDLPPALDAVVLQALAKQPEHRFKSAGVFAQALRSAAVDLEPGFVRVASAARALAAPTFSGVTLPSAQGGAEPMLAVVPAQTVGQQVARYLPVALAVLGLLLVGSIVLKYWALVILLAILLGGGAFLFMYLRASSQGRQAARETTRAITTASVRTATPPLVRETAVLDDRISDPLAADAAAPTQPMDAPVAAKQTLRLDDQDDTPELPLPDDPTQALGSVPALEAELPPTEAIRIAPDELSPTEAVPVTDEQMPTEAVPTTPAAPTTEESH